MKQTSIADNNFLVHSDLANNQLVSFSDKIIETSSQDTQQGLPVIHIETASNNDTDNIYKIDSSYVAYVYSKIERAKYYPENAKENNITGKVKLTFTVKNNGELGYVKIMDSSKNELLDNAAITTIKNASPFKKFPESIKGKEMLFAIPIVYKIGE